MDRRSALAWMVGGPALPVWAEDAAILRLVVPSAPGGSGDVIPRLFAPVLSRELAQSVIVENRPGAGGRVGALHVAHAPRDGQTLCVANVSTFAVYPALASAPAYDPLKDFDLVGTLVDVPSVLCTGPAVATESLSAFIGAARDPSRDLAFASPGPASLGHLMGLLFNRATGARLRHIPYRGAGPALQDVAAGHVQALFDNLPASLPHIRAGRLRALAVSAPGRLPLLPNVPTFREAGLPDLNDGGWFGLAAPAGVDPRRIGALTVAIQRAMADERLRAHLRELGATPARDGPAGLRSRVQTAKERYGRLGTQAGVRIDG